MPHFIDRSRCLCCHNCALECPVQAISYVGTGYAVDGEKCIDCGHCARVCNVDAARPDRPEAPAPAHAPERREADLPIFRESCRWLDAYFSGKDPGFTPKLCLRTTPFRKAVWKILLTIPYGKTMTYGEIAARIASLPGKGRMSARAVGGAVGRNAISLMIPCHRVVGAGGSLTGYAAGIDKKLRLLSLEGG